MFGMDNKVPPFNELPERVSSLSLKFAGGAGIELCKACTATTKKQLVITIRIQVTLGT